MQLPNSLQYIPRNSSSSVGSKLGVRVGDWKLVSSLYKAIRGTVTRKEILKLSTCLLLQNVRTSDAFRIFDRRASLSCRAVHRPKPVQNVVSDWCSRYSSTLTLFHQ